MRWKRDCDGMKNDGSMRSAKDLGRMMLTFPNEDRRCQDRGALTMLSDLQRFAIHGTK